MKGYEGNKEGMVQSRVGQAKGNAEEEESKVDSQMEEDKPSDEEQVDTANEAQSSLVMDVVEITDSKRKEETAE